MSYIEHLQKDKKLGVVLSRELPELKCRKNIALRLMASIMSQQLSSKVAEVIYRRFLTLFGDKEPTAEQVLSIPKETYRSIGLSNAKAAYIHNVAIFCIEQKISDKKLKAMSNDDIIVLFTQIKGVGKWTVEMLLMFTLGREDIFPVDDLGIQNAMSKLYNLDMVDRKKLKEKMLKLSDKWKPYRTYACLHLWKMLDSVQV
ncbi:MAG TPA: DNA-3-methyladenine glycosylase 2 family protein [Arachidicoccus sp.]